MPTFRPLCLNALYTGSDRGLTADLFAARDLGGRPQAVCTTLITASHGHVTDVLPVPSDTVEAQLEHLFDAVPQGKRPTAARIAIVGQEPTVEAVFRHLGRRPDVPVLLDLTLSGPSGEDIADAGALDALKAHLAAPKLVTVRRADAELVAGMEIASLDDAQVAVQRLHRLGARAVLLRCGVLPARHFDAPDAAEPLAADLFYDGDEFHLFEAPHVRVEVRGASSVFGLALLDALAGGDELVPAVQRAKRHVTDWLRDRADASPVEAAAP